MEIVVFVCRQQKLRHLVILTNEGGDLTTSYR